MRSTLLVQLMPIEMLSEVSGAGAQAMAPDPTKVIRFQSPCRLSGSNVCGTKLLSVPRPKSVLPGVPKGEAPGSPANHARTVTLASGERLRFTTKECGRSESSLASVISIDSVPNGRGLMFNSLPGEPSS